MRIALPFLALAASLVPFFACSGAELPLQDGKGGEASASSTAAGDKSSTATGLFDAGLDSSMPCNSGITCESMNANCGPIPDGCGGVLDCGKCTSPEICGGGGVPSQCSMSTSCTPKTCQDLGVGCGPAGDGCGKQLDCGSCTAPDTCGGGGTPSQCGTGGTCTPKSCVDLGVGCGPAGDGCGNQLDCGSCTAPDTCGGGGTPSECGHPICKPKQCNPGVDCGPVADGCGGLLQCGGCNQPEQCGGLAPSQCGVPASCTGLCLQQTTCSNPNTTTTISGVVYAPGHKNDPPPPWPGSPDPLYNFLVYIPNAPVQPFTPGVACEPCSASVSGSPLVSTYSDTDGKFTLTNVPVGKNIPLVIQNGRWRRQITIPNVVACQDNPLTQEQTRLPRNKSEGDIPHMAFATGAVDSLECVLRKIGIDDAEFTTPSQSGRIHLYEGLVDSSVPEGAMGGATLPGAPTEDQLWGTQAALDQYDMVLFPCQQNQTSRASAVQQNLINYANAGGRVFATHFSYVWLYNDAPFSGTAKWNVEQHPSPSDQNGIIDQSFPKGADLASWLENVGATFIPGIIPLNVLRWDSNGVIPPTQQWIYLTNPVDTVHFTFNTPIGAKPDNQCGRVLFDDFHVENQSDTYGVNFPAECDSNPMTAQEKLLEFMIFDLGSCVTPDQPTCNPKTCKDLGVNCGPAGDGCGGQIDCGSCPMGQTCGGNGMPNQCGSPSCVPLSCGDQKIQCGPAGDGCGNKIDCGSCPMGETCGGGGMPGVCGNSPCNPVTCADQGILCGPAGDGCGNALDCGSCPDGQSCGGGGMPGVCGTDCVPKTCQSANANCGPLADGCGHLLDCGTCTNGICGGSGTPNQCGGTH